MADNFEFHKGRLREVPTAKTRLLDIVAGIILAILILCFGSVLVLAISLVLMAL